MIARGTEFCSAFTDSGHMSVDRCRNLPDRLLGMKESSMSCRHRLRQLPHGQTADSDKHHGEDYE